MANPVWYPVLEPALREKVLRFASSVLEAPRFEPARANAYCGA